MMKRLLFGSLITANGKSTFSGLYDENGKHVKLMLEKDGDDVMLAVFTEGGDDDYDDDQPCDCGISEEEFDRVCQEQKDCDNCPLCGYCNDVFGEEDDEDDDVTGCPERAGCKEEMRC